jgi:hypothetical protein
MYMLSGFLCARCQIFYVRSVERCRLLIMAVQVPAFVYRERGLS